MQGNENILMKTGWYIKQEWEKAQERNLRESVVASIESLWNLALYVSSIDLNNFGHYEEKEKNKEDYQKTLQLWENGVAYALRDIECAFSDFFALRKECTMQSEEAYKQWKYDRKETHNPDAGKLTREDIEAHELATGRIGTAY